MITSNQNTFASQVVELDSPLSDESFIYFDPDRLTLEGAYRDEITAFRARRGWKEALESYFLLDPTRDINFIVRHNPERGCYNLSCKFSTACARYAFWRLTNNQAPEAQYLIETAHVPKGESQQDRYLAAPDLAQIPGYREGEDPLVLNGELDELYDEAHTPLSVLLDRILEKMKSPLLPKKSR